jgi:hypothetical protein
MLVNDADLDLLDGHHFYIHMGYARAQESHTFARQAGRKSRRWIHLSRLVASRMLGRQLDQAEIVDHINGDTLDNRRVNIRVCTNAQNTRNRKTHRNNSSGHRGVQVSPKCPKRPYYAVIFTGGTRKYLGSFSSLEQAAKARREAEKTYFGAYAPSDQRDLK